LRILVKTRFKMTGTASWDKISHIVISKVFGYLRNKDKFNASLVCKDWSDALNSSSIWRSVKLDITGYDGVNDEKTVKKAEKVGEWVKEVEIMCGYTTEGIVDDINRIFNSMDKAKLTKFVLNNLEVDTYSGLNQIGLDKLFASINRFIGTQTCLQWFEMLECHISVASGVELLENLSLVSCNTLEFLDISNFFRSSGGVNEIHSVPAFRLLMARFTQLKFVSMNYHCLDDEILLALAKNCEGTLQEITVFFVDDDEPSFNTISTSTWKEVRRQCPKLGIYMYQLISPGYANINCFFTRGMPLTKLFYCGNLNSEETTGLIQHLNFFIDSLEELELSIEADDDSNSEIVANFITSCRNLKVLNYVGILREREVKVICEAQKEGRLNLKRCFLGYRSNDDGIQDTGPYTPVFAAQSAEIRIRCFGTIRSANRVPRVY